jgi:transposase-like protein
MGPRAAFGVGSATVTSNQICPIRRRSTGLRARGVALWAFETNWGGNDPAIGQSWRWVLGARGPAGQITPVIRQMIYAANAVKIPNRMRRKSIKTSARSVTTMCNRR